MATAGDSLFTALNRESARLLADARRLLRLRWRLLELEGREAVIGAWRLGVALLISAALLLTGLPLLLSALAEGLYAWWGLPRGIGLVGLGSGFVAAGLIWGWTQWNGFRRRFSGLEQSLEELREDARWLRKHLGREQ